MPSRVRYLRYAIVALHISLAVATTIISSVLALRAVLLIVQLVAGLALLFYLPAAVTIAMFADSGKEPGGTFDRAGVEVAYVAIQCAAWTISAVFSGIYVSPQNCDGRVSPSVRGASRGQKADDMRTCQVLLAVIVLSGIHVLILLSWISLVVYLVYTRAGIGMGRKEAFRLPMWRLIRGEPARREVTAALPPAPTTDE